MSVLHIVYLLSLLYHHGLLVSATSNRVFTRQGYVLGKTEAVQYSNGLLYNVFEFLGIPYAKSPTGELRFKPPQPLEKLRQNDYDATYNRSVCIQYKADNPYKEVLGSEDCLYLNIYTPSTTCKANRKYPVMVYIHPGGYLAGTPVRDASPGEYLPRHAVVLVTIQYRIGAFGFFTTGDSEAPGNLGLLDQIEALKWIQKNIHGFCGDKNSVILLGDGAGGSSVTLHYLSPLTKGLFHRGIAMSGVALAPFALKPKSTVLKASKSLIKGLGCEKENSQLTVQCLRKLKYPNDIIRNNKDGRNMQPFVDGYFLPHKPRKLLEEGRFHKLPLVSGFVTNEELNDISKQNISNAAEYEEYLDKHFFPQSLHSTKQQAPTAFDAVAFRYTPWGNLQKPEAYKENAIDMLNDYAVIAPIHELLSLHSKHGAKTYMFQFAHRSHKNRSLKLKWEGEIHDDTTTAYEFGLPLLESSKTKLKFDDNDRSVSKTMVTLFTNFAKTGNPNTPSPLTGVQWTGFNTSNEAYLKIQTKPAMASQYHSRRMLFWNDYFPTLLPCVQSGRKSWYGQCKRSKAGRSLRSL